MADVAEPVHRGAHGQQRVHPLFHAGLSRRFHRGRDRPHGRPPAQIPACGTTALGSCLRSERRSAAQSRDAAHGQVATTGLQYGPSGPR